MPNALTNQNSTIYLELGFSTLTSTLLGIPSGVIEIITIGTGVYLLGRFPNSRGIISIIYFVPNILGSILVIALPYENKNGILISLYITGFGTTGFVICLAWLQATTAGHTKKVSFFLFSKIFLPVSSKMECFPSLMPASFQLYYANDH